MTEPLHIRQVVHVTYDTFTWRERDHGDARAVLIHSEVGQQFLDELYLLHEVVFADTRGAVDQEQDVELAAAGGVFQVQDVTYNGNTRNLRHAGLRFSKYSLILS